MIDKFIEKHGDKYDYSKVDTNNLKVIIICKLHGEFLQNKYSHKYGMGCWDCSVIYRSNLQRGTNEDFIKKSNKIHEYRYDYSLVDYKNNNTKVKIICKIHGLFEQVPLSHLSKNGCPSCGKLSMSNKQRLTTSDFIEKSKLVHLDRYDYSLVKYGNNNNTKVEIICKKHGVFSQLPSNHLSGQGCGKCVGKGKKTIDFIREGNIIHNGLYDYSLVEYLGSSEKVSIICKKHGVFRQDPKNHIFSKHGCPNCYTKIKNQIPMNS